MKEILIFTDDISKYGNYRSYLETGVSTTSLRATLNEVLDHLEKKNVDIIIVDLDIPRIKKKNLKFLEFIRQDSIDIFLMIRDITDDALITCSEYDCITIVKKPFDPEVLMRKLGIVVDLVAAEEKNLDEAVRDFDSPFYDNEEITYLEEDENGNQTYG